MKKKWIWLTLVVNALLCFAVSVFYLWRYTGWSLGQNILVVGAGGFATIYPDNMLWFVQMIHILSIGVLIYIVVKKKWNKVAFAVLHVAMATHWIWTAHFATVISSW